VWKNFHLIIFLWPIHSGVFKPVCRVGYNIAKVVCRLDNNVAFASLIGDDLLGRVIEAQLIVDHIPYADIVRELPVTAQSAVLYDGTGRRQIHTDE